MERFHRSRVGRPRDWVLRGRHAWYRNPRLLLALRTAVAATIAWAIALLLPAPLSEYPYYAPLGVVVTSSITLASSARETVRVLVAVLAGAALGASVQYLGVPDLPAIALVVAVGIVAAGWAALGTAGSWIPTSGLFVLVLGQRDPGDYVIAYAGLVLLGALIAIAMAAALPPVPLTPAAERVGRLRDTLAEQLSAVADGLLLSHPPTRDEWRGRFRNIEPVLAEMRAAVQQADEARRGNPRVRKYQQQADRLYAQARALESVTFLVEDLTELIAETEVAEHQRVALGPSLRPAAADAIGALGEVLRTMEGAAGDEAATARAYAGLRWLADELREVRRTTDDDLFTASSVVEVIRRSLAAVVPEELARQEDRAQGSTD